MFVITLRVGSSFCTGSPSWLPSTHLPDTPLGQTSQALDALVGQKKIRVLSYRCLCWDPSNVGNVMPTSHQVPKIENCSWFISAAMSPSPCPLYLWFHHDHSAYCRSIFGISMFLHLKVPSKLRTPVVLGFLFPFIMEMDRNDVWVCNTSCDGSPYFLGFFFCYSIALAAHACCTHVIFSHLMTQHSSKFK